MIRSLLPAIVLFASLVGAQTIDQGMGQEVEFRLFRPAPSVDKRVPLVVYLHVNGGNPMFETPWFQDELQATEPCFLLLPHVLRPAGQAADWGGTYDATFRPTLAEVVEIVDSLRRVHPIDSQRIYVYGGSMGAEGVFALLAYRPGLASAAVAVAGYTKKEAPMVEAMARTPFWILHGGADDLNPTSSSRDIFRAILDAGGKRVRYTEYAGYGHNDIWGRVPSETSLVPWMLLQRKDSTAPAPAPDSVRNLRIAGNQLSWNPSPSAGVWFQSVYQDGRLVAQMDATDTSFSLEGLPATGTEWSVSASDFHFRESAKAIWNPSASVGYGVDRDRSTTAWIAGRTARVAWPQACAYHAELATLDGRILSSTSGWGREAALDAGAHRGAAVVRLRLEGESERSLRVMRLE